MKPIGIGYAGRTSVESGRWRPLEEKDQAKAMECPNCGQNVDLSAGERYVKCTHCNTTVAALRTTKEYTSLKKYSDFPEGGHWEIIYNMKLAEVDVDNRNYQAAHEKYGNILEKYPWFWEALLNQSVSVFWMGREDLTRMRQVKPLLDEADVLSGKNGKVESTRIGIAYNIAVIGSKKERYGNNIFWSIECFKISKDLMRKYVARDQIVDTYVTSAYKEIERRLLKTLARDKMNFDPPKSELDCLYTLFLFSRESSKAIASTFIAFADQKLRVNKNLQDLPQKLDEVKAIFSRSFKGAGIPKIHFPLFGSPRIN